MSAWSAQTLPPQAGAQPRTRASEMAALVASSNYLLHLQNKLSLVEAATPSVPALSPLPMRVDDRFNGGVLTHSRKSMLPAEAPNRIASEVYPLAPPRWDMWLGTNTRLIGRDPAVL